MEREELEALVRRGERAKVDLKAEHRLDVGDDTSKEKRCSDLAWDIAAMTNMRGGPGYLIIGVNEKTGLPSKAGAVGIGADQIQRIMVARCDPPVGLGWDGYCRIPRTCWGGRRHFACGASTC